MTIVGESAGSQDVSLLLAAPAAQGLFEKAIMESGTPGFGMPYRSLAEAEKLGEQFATSADAAGDLAKLRATSPVALLKLQETFGEPATRDASFVFLRTTIDGKVLPEAPDALIAANKPKPVIIGTDKIEFGPGDDNIDLADHAHYWFGDDGAQALAAYRAEQCRSAPRKPGAADAVRRRVPLPDRPACRPDGEPRLAGLALRIRHRRERRADPSRLRSQLGVRAQAGRRRGRRWRITGPRSRSPAIPTARPGGPRRGPHGSGGTRRIRANWRSASRRRRWNPASRARAFCKFADNF